MLGSGPCRFGPLGDTVFIVALCGVFRSIATIAAVDHVRQKEECDQIGGLVKQQRQICKRNVDMMDAVKSGAVHSIDQCQYQFRYRRWNCSTVNTATVFGRIVKAGQSLAVMLSPRGQSGLGPEVLASAWPRSRCLIM